VRVQLLDVAGRVIGPTPRGILHDPGKVDLVTPERGDSAYAGTTRFVRWVSERFPVSRRRT